MSTIREQIQHEKKIKQEKIKDIFYVDYCNNCKNKDIRGVYGKDYTYCHHPWYCHHDNGPVQEVETHIAKINENIRLRGFMCSHEYKELNDLKEVKFNLICDCRRNMPRIKH